MKMGGVIPENLDLACALYDKYYLISLIKDRALASYVYDKYADKMLLPM